MQIYLPVQKKALTFVLLIYLFTFKLTNMILLLRPIAGKISAAFIKGVKGWKKGLVATLLIGTLIAARTAPDYSKAETNQVQGLFLFVDSKPTHEFTYLGTVKNGTRFTGSAQYTAVRDRLIKKIKADYPEADGIIFYFNNGETDRADAIKFKP